MTGPDAFTNLDSQQVPATDPFINRIEDLRHILESELRRPVALSEAREIGEDLLTFYEVLAAPETVTQPAEPLGGD